MTISVQQFPAVSPIATAGIQSLENQQASLQASVASGVRADSYAGLGDSRYQVLDLSPSITELSAWQQNVSTAQSTLSVTQTTLSSISGIVSALHSTLVGLQGGEGAAGVTAAVAQAGSALTQLADLVNTRNGSDYIFSGIASDTAPVPAPDQINTGSLFQAVQAAVAAVGSTGASAAQDAIAAAAGNNTPGLSPFSAALSVDPTAAAALQRGISVGADESVGVGVVATAGTAPSSTSTGSPIRDLFGVLAAVSSLGSADTGSPNFSDLVSDLTTWTGQIGDQLTGTASTLGSDQDVLTQRSTSLSNTGDALAAQLGTLRNGDAASLSVQVTTIQNQLTASYSLVADNKNLFLADFL